MPTANVNRVRLRTNAVEPVDDGGNGKEPKGADLISAEDRALVARWTIENARHDEQTAFGLLQLVGLPLSRVRRADVSDYVVKLENSGMSPDGVRQRVNTIGRLFDFLRRAKLIAQSPVRKAVW
ncbi:MAG: hypothetical protein JSU86_09005 [Phycisphaerales bacterium]|nr:MAG: hypothetical protein JSU86_09005 [Phycisphaerales bacterium]